MNYKAILVSNGFSQVYGVDDTKKFALVTKMDSIGLVLAIVASKRWEVHHMDVKSEFIEVDIYGDVSRSKRPIFHDFPTTSVSVAPIPMKFHD